MANSNTNNGGFDMLIKAYGSLQNDMENRLLGVLEQKMQLVREDMLKLHSGMEAMRMNLEYLHKENRDGKKNFEILEGKLKEKDTEIEELTNKMKEQKEEDENTAQTDGGESSQGQASGDDKNFKFEDKIEGKNVLIGNEVAAVSEGGDMAFAKPPQRSIEDTNVMINRGAELPVGNGTGATNGAASGDIPTVDGRFIGNDNVNIQRNEQNIFLAGPRDIEVDESGEPIKYSRAEREEISGFLDRQISNAETAEDAISLSNLEEESLNRATIIRVANLYKQEETAEHFIRLCDSLVTLTARQRRSLAPNLGHITRIDLTNAEIELNRLSAFFKCFKGKRFHWLLLRNRSIRANDIRVLASSLSSCKIIYLDMGICSFEYMAFLKMTVILPHVDFLILRRLTQAHIIPENSTGTTHSTMFSAREAHQLSETILESKKSIGLELSECNLSDPHIATEFAKCMQKIHSFSLKHGMIDQYGFKTLASGITKMYKIDLSCVDLRGVDIQDIASLFTRVDVLVLSKVMLVDDVINKLFDELGKLPENAMHALDLSYNPLNNATVSRAIENVGRVKLIVFSKEQINYTKHSDEIDQEKILMSETVGNGICRIDETDASKSTHWVVCVKPITNTIRRHVNELTIIDQQEMESRSIENFHCRNCKTHIAFRHDVIQLPCSALQNDKKLWGVFDKNFVTTVSRTSSCVPTGSSSGKKHSCSTINCNAQGYKMRICKCAVCSQTIGGFYQNKMGLMFFCLYQETVNCNDVGSSEQSCRQS